MPRYITKNKFKKNNIIHTLFILVPAPTPAPPIPVPGCEDPDNRPNFAHETDCNKYYHCEDDGGKSEKECAPAMTFSKVSMECEWTDEVVPSQRPECQSKILR